MVLWWSRLRGCCVLYTSTGFAQGKCFIFNEILSIRLKCPTDFFRFIYKLNKKENCLLAVWPLKSLENKVYSHYTRVFQPRCVDNFHIQQYDLGFMRYSRNRNNVFFVMNSINYFVLGRKTSDDHTRRKHSLL